MQRDSEIQMGLDEIRMSGDDLAIERLRFLPVSLKEQSGSQIRLHAGVLRIQLKVASELFLRFGEILRVVREIPAGSQRFQVARVQAHDAIERLLCTGTVLRVDERGPVASARQPLPRFQAVRGCVRLRCELIEEFDRFLGQSDRRMLGRELLGSRPCLGAGHAAGAAGYGSRRRARSLFGGVQGDAAHDQKANEHAARGGERPRASRVRGAHAADRRSALRAKSGPRDQLGPAVTAELVSGCLRRARCRHPGATSRNPGG